MGEVSEMFDVKPSLLRHWESKFDILRPHKNKKGNRMFTPEDVENLKLIYHLVKERGMTLNGAAQYLRNGVTDTMRRDMMLLDRLRYGNCCATGRTTHCQMRMMRRPRMRNTVLTIKQWTQHSPSLIMRRRIPRLRPQKVHMTTIRMKPLCPETRLRIAHRSSQALWRQLR